MFTVRLSEFDPAVTAQRLRSNNFYWLTCPVWDEHEATDVEQSNRLLFDQWVQEFSKHEDMHVIPWVNPRTNMQAAAKAASTYADITGSVIFDCEAEFKYTGGDYNRAGQLMREWRSRQPHADTAISGLGRADMEDVHWTAFSSAGCRYLPQAYFNEHDHLGVAACMRGAVTPRMVTGWEYRVRLLGTRWIQYGRMASKTIININGSLYDVRDKRTIWQKKERIGSLLGFFPLSWVHPTIGLYDPPGDRGRPHLTTVFNELKAGNDIARSQGGQLKGVSIYTLNDTSDEMLTSIGRLA